MHTEEEVKILIRQIELAKELKIESASPITVLGHNFLITSKNGKIYMNLEIEVPDLEDKTLINTARKLLEVQRKIQTL
jgi:hypothetical protein